MGLRPQDGGRVGHHGTVRSAVKVETTGLVEPGGSRDWQSLGGDHRDWLVARWRPQCRQSQVDTTGTGRTRWRPRREFTRK